MQCGGVKRDKVKKSDKRGHNPKRVMVSHALTLESDTSGVDPRDANNNKETDKAGVN